VSSKVFRTDAGEHYVIPGYDATVPDVSKLVVVYLYGSKCPRKIILGHLEPIAQ